MLEKTVLVVSVGRRESMLRRLLDDLSTIPQLASWNVVAVLQEYPTHWSHPRLNDVLRYGAGIGPHRARWEGLQAWRSEVWCNIDDDTELLPQVDWQTPADFVRARPDVGFVSCGWARSHKLLERTVHVHASDPRAWVKQPIVYTAGGLVYTDTTADLILARTGPTDLLFDDVEWSLQTYICGRLNFRYRGSVVLHRALRADGREPWVRSRDCVPPDPRYLHVRRMTRPYYAEHPVNDILICDSRDLTPEAHARHRSMRLANKWDL